MPQCSASGCTNRTDGGIHNVPRDLSFHAFPLRNEELLKQWRHNLGRPDFTPTKASKLCSAHFLPSCFKEDVYGKYGITLTTADKNRKRPRVLTEDAVPTEFVRRSAAAQAAPPAPTRVSSVSQVDRQERQRQIAQVL
ncbi:THAP domain-containing protein 1-like [Liolophura sinensis]|uniref:THAP domain-containing protein 1-like n=1 Tax=Liolophura sinensis TaxID=3198878 RepID=UPI0031596070